MKRWTWALSAALLVLSVGCESTPLGTWTGPDRPPTITRGPWEYKGTPGQVLDSEDYRLCTTIANPNYQEKLVTVLEGGLQQYRKVVPTAPPTLQTGGRMDCYVFASRPQWLDFTARHTGPDAKLYSQITRGGYTIRDWFVAYETAERDTLSVAAHEGFHQFCARHLKGRFPPFLEEGLATSFEVVRWDNGLPRFNPKVNSDRAQALRTCIDTHMTIPLTTLVTLHAGSVLGGDGWRIQAFYSEGWAFGRMMREDPRYAPLFATWAADTQSGKLFDPTGTHRLLQQFWDPRAVTPIMEHYLKTDFATLQADFDVWCHKLAYDEFNAQFAS